MVGVTSVFVLYLCHDRPHEIVAASSKAEASFLKFNALDTLDSCGKALKL